MLSNYIFYYTDSKKDFNSDVSSEYVQYVLNEGYADIKAGHLTERDVVNLPNIKL